MVISAEYHILLSPNGSLKLQMTKHSFLPDAVLLQSYVGNDGAELKRAVSEFKRGIDEIKAGRRDALGNLIYSREFVVLPEERPSLTSIE